MQSAGEQEWTSSTRLAEEAGRKVSWPPQGVQQACPLRALCVGGAGGAILTLGMKAFPPPPPIGLSSPGLSLVWQ